MIRQHGRLRTSGFDPRADSGSPASAGIAGSGSAIGRAMNAGSVVGRAGVSPRYAVPTISPGEAICSAGDGFPARRAGHDATAGG